MQALFIHNKTQSFDVFSDKILTYALLENSLLESISQNATLNALAYDSAKTLFALSVQINVSISLFILISIAFMN